MANINPIIAKAVGMDHIQNYTPHTLAAQLLQRLYKPEANPAHTNQRLLRKDFAHVNAKSFFPIVGKLVVAELIGFLELVVKVVIAAGTILSMSVTYLYALLINSISKTLPCFEDHAEDAFTAANTQRKFMMRLIKQGVYQLAAPFSKLIPNITITDIIGDIPLISSNNRNTTMMCLGGEKSLDFRYDYLKEIEKTLKKAAPEEAKALVRKRFAINTSSKEKSQTMTLLHYVLSLAYFPHPIHKGAMARLHEKIAEVTELILTHDLDLMALDEIQGAEGVSGATYNTPLLHAVYTGNIPAAKAILEHLDRKGDMDLKRQVLLQRDKLENMGNRNPLEGAMALLNLPMILLLLEHGFDVYRDEPIRGQWIEDRERDPTGNNYSKKYGMYIHLLPALCFIYKVATGNAADHAQILKYMGHIAKTCKDPIKQYLTMYVHKGGGATETHFLPLTDIFAYKKSHRHYLEVSPLRGKFGTVAHRNIPNAVISIALSGEIPGLEQADVEKRLKEDVRFKEVRTQIVNNILQPLRKHIPDKDMKLLAPYLDTEKHIFKHEFIPVGRALKARIGQRDQEGLTGRIKARLVH